MIPLGQVGHLTTSDVEGKREGGGLGEGWRGVCLEGLEGVVEGVDVGPQPSGVVRRSAPLLTDVSSVSLTVVVALRYGTVPSSCPKQTVRVLTQELPPTPPIQCRPAHGEGRGGPGGQPRRVNRVTTVESRDLSRHLH